MGMLEKSTRWGALGLTAAAAASLVTTAAGAQDTPRDLSDLIDARASSGELEMERRGYRFVSAETGDDRKWTSWWNAARSRCVTIATMDGRYVSIVEAPAPDCNQRAASGGDRGYPQAGGGNDRGYERGDDRGGLQLTLICYGAGEKPSLDVRTEYEWDRSDHRYRPRTVTSSGNQGFSSAVQVDIDGDQGRIHLTGKLIAPINSGGDRGWWRLDNLRIDRDRITGQYRMNGLNQPRVTIDRRVGSISIRGIESFDGQCDVGNWSGGNRF